MTQQPKDDQSFSPWQYIALGAGAAVVAGGVVTMILGLRDQDDAHSMRDCAEERTCNPPPRLDEINSKQDSADTKKVLGYALIGIGGALVITGSVLLILDLSKDDEPVVARKPNRYALAFDVMPMLGGGAASVSGRF